jgi:hypothetical protein
VHAGVPPFLLQRSRIQITFNWSIVETSFEHVHESLWLERTLQIQILEFRGNHIIVDNEISQHLVSVNLAVKIRVLVTNQIQLLENVKDHLAISGGSRNLQIFWHVVMNFSKYINLKYEH